jgi:hypothetical protein
MNILQPKYRGIFLIHTDSSKIPPHTLHQLLRWQQSWSLHVLEQQSYHEAKSTLRQQSMTTSAQLLFNSIEVNVCSVSKRKSITDSYWSLSPVNKRRPGNRSKTGHHQKNRYGLPDLHTSAHYCNFSF